MKIKYLSDVINLSGKVLKNKLGEQIKIEEITAKYIFLPEIYKLNKHKKYFSHFNVKILENYNSFCVLVDRKFKNTGELIDYFNNYELEEENS